MSTKLHSSPPEELFRSFFLKVFVLLEFFVRWAGVFENSREKIVEVCWNCTLRVGKKKLVKELFLKNLKFILFFQISRKKINDRVVWISFYVYRGKVWKKIYYEKIHKLSKFPDFDPKLFGLLDEKILPGLSKLHSICRANYFSVKLSLRKKIHGFLTFSDFDQKLFWFQQNSIRSHKIPIIILEKVLSIFFQKDLRKKDHLKGACQKKRVQNKNLFPETFLNLW